MIKSVKLAELSVKIVIAFLDEQCLLIEYNNCNKNYQKKFDEKLKKRFFNKYKFSNHDINNFILFYFIVAKRCLPIWIHEWLRKIHWNIITWKRRFLQSPKYGKYYWCRLHALKKLCKDFEIKELREYHDLHVQSDE